MDMATQVLIAHSGQRLQLDASQFSSVDEFKASVARHTSIPAQNIIAITAQGRPVKFQTLQAEKEIYVYDNRLGQAPSSGASTAIKVDIPLPKRYVVTAPPNFVNDTRSLQSWQDLFEARRAWAVQVAEDCRQMAEATRERYKEMDIMLRCLDGAVANTESIVKALEPRYRDVQEWVPTAQAEFSALTTSWEQHLSLARSIPISANMVRFMTGRDMSAGKGRPPKQATLEDLIDLDTARRAGRLAPSALRKFNARMADLDKVASRMSQDSENLTSEFERTVARSALSHDADAKQLYQDIEAVVKKIETDCQTILDFTSPKDALQASKIAQNHTDRLLPSIRNRSLEMDEMLWYATQARNRLANESVDFMRTITGITSLSQTVKSQVNAPEQEDENNTFDYLRLIQQVPYMYASYAAESLRRREWFEKVKQDSSTLANEMALFQEEELKRRRKWHKAIGATYGPETLAGDGNVPGLEVNVLGEDEQWPAVTKKDLEDFYETLQKQKASPEIITDVGKLIMDLNNPTKQQSKRMKAFKNGSVHEAALGRSGLMIRGDDDLLRALQDDKSKLESKLKTAESRVRRLEDLLHRQSQASRPSIGNLFQLPSQQLSERNDSTISVKSPRVGEEHRRSLEVNDALLQRVQHLEAELGAEKERSAVFEKDLTARTTEHNDIKGQMEEVNSTKKDLLENMEALKREFMDERKSLEDEIKQLKARLEDTEDDLEHFGESRENEKATFDEKVLALGLEIEQLTRAKQDDDRKAEGQVDFLRKEARLQRERVEALEKELQSAQDAAKVTVQKLEEADEAADLQLRTLRELHEQLAPSDPVPLGVADLVESVSGKMADAVAKIRDLQKDVALARADLEASHAHLRNTQDELLAAKESLSEEESKSKHLRDALAEERARATTLETELSESREHLNQLRVQIADGETGSESLRKELEEQEEKVASLTEAIASKQSQLGSLEEEVLLYKEKLQDSQAKLADVNVRFEARTERTKDLTQRLYSQNDRLTRLLDRLSFSIVRQGESMIIQRVPRSERSPQNTGDTDPSASMRKSGTLSNYVVVDTGDLELLQWTTSSDVADESAKYEAFMSNLGNFDIDAFTEAMYRRVKDVEHMARKLQREARSFRDKAHHLQKEAHDKIAYKHFKEGDLALFLPTRNQTTGAWAAFNVGFPHYFLSEQESHRLRSREWLLARITRVQERVVDLSKSLQQHPKATPTKKDDASVATVETESLYDDENDNPFDLSDGLRWYLIDAQEDKSGAPSTPGLGKSTVAANNVEAMADLSTHGRVFKGGVLGSRGGLPSAIEGVSKTLSKSLESRRSSTGSRKALPFAVGIVGRGRDSAQASETNSLRAAPADTPVATSPTQQQTNHHGVAAGASSPLAQADPDTNDEAAVAAGNGNSKGDPAREGARSPEARHRRPLARHDSAASVESPTKRSVIWDSLWSMDVSYVGGKRAK